MLSIRPLDLSKSAESEAWDQFVQAHSKGTAFHLTAWGRAIEKGLQHPVYYLGAWSGSDLVGALPLTNVKTKLFGNALISNAFAVQGGPLAYQQDIEQRLDDAAWELAQKLGASSLEYRHDQKTRPSWPSKSETYVTFKRALSENSDDNMKAIARKQRAEVRKSLEKNLQVSIQDHTNEHFPVYAQSVRNLGTPVFPKRWFEALLWAYGKDADVLTVTSEGKPVASVLSLYYADQVLPYYGGGTHEARALRANDHMYWMLMEHAARRGCKVFDFGRSKIGTGAYAFKKNWGFEPTPLVYEYRLAPGQSMPDVNPLNPKYQLMVSTWQRLPLFIANAIGPWIARGLG